MVAAVQDDDVKVGDADGQVEPSHMDADDEDEADEDAKVIDADDADVAAALLALPDFAAVADGLAPLLTRGCSQSYAGSASSGSERSSPVAKIPRVCLSGNDTRNPVPSSSGITPAQIESAVAAATALFVSEGT